jgi:hypothetical protein
MASTPPGPLYVIPAPAPATAGQPIDLKRDAAMMLDFNPPVTAFSSSRSA